MATKATKGLATERLMLLMLEKMEPGSLGCSKNPNVSLVLVRFSELLRVLSPHLTCTYYVEIAFGIVILSTL